MADEELQFEPNEASTETTDTPIPADQFSTGGVPEARQETASSPAASQQVDPTPPSIRDLVRNLGGILPSQVGDDYTALAYLVNQSRQAEALAAAQRQADVYTQLGRQLAPQANQIGQYLQQQQQPQAPPAWEPPPFDKRWLGLVKMDDASGTYIGVHPTVHPGIIDAVNKYADWRAQFMDNPMAMIQPAIDAARTRWLEEARAENRQMYERSQLETATRGIVQNISPWFYQYDAQGNALADPMSGQPLPSQLGQQYLATLNLLKQNGVTNPVALDRLAQMYLGPQIQAALGQTEAAPPVQLAARQAQARRSTGGRNRNPLQALGSQEREETRGVSNPEQQRMSLADRLRTNLEAGGVTDRDLRLMPTG